jgi:hypothetical protein
MNVDRERLLADEAVGWRRFSDVVTAIPPSRAEDPTVTPDGWSPKDTLFHVAAWLELCADVCDRIAAGTWDPETAEEETLAFVDRINAEQFDRARAMTPHEVEVRLARARERAREAFAAQPEMTRDAWGWFEESGPMHYAKHVHDLAAFSAGVRSDPEVGPLLQAETDAWLELVAALDAVPADAFTRAAVDGWSPRDALHHLVRWLELSTPAVEANRYWYEGSVPAPGAVIDEMNADFLAEAATDAAREEGLRVELERVRTRMREALSGLTAPSDDAKRTFAMNTIEHYAEHVATFRDAPGTSP